MRKAIWVSDQAVANVVGLVLALGAVSSVLAFGGVEILAFAPAQIAVAMLATAVFWQRGWPLMSLATSALLGTLLAIPLLQLIPLPRSLAVALSPARVALADELSALGIAFPKTLALTVNSYETGSALLRFICYVLVLLLAIRAYQWRGDQARLIGVLTGLGIFEALYGMIQYLTGWQYIFFFKKQFYTQVATGTYINHNHFAGLLEMVLPFLLARILIRTPAHGRVHHSRWKQIIISPITSYFLRDMVLFAVVAVALVFSQSRMGIIAGVLGLLLVMGITFLQTRRRSVLAIMFLILAIPVAYSAWIGLAPVVDRFALLEHSEAFGRDRLLVWRDTVALIQDYPLFGTGLGTYRWASLHYQTYMLDHRYEHAHNDYLEFAADIGIPGTVVLFASLWILVLKAARRALVSERPKDKILAAGSAGAMASLLIHAIADFNFQIPANAYLFSWIAGTTAALVQKPMRGELGVQFEGRKE